MHNPFRNIFCLVVFSALILFGQPLWVAGQEDETPTSAPAKAASIDTQSLFSGAIPKTIGELRFMENHFAELAEKVKAATVNIQMGAAQGSGVVVSSDGYVLTAAHVIGRPNQKATITFIDSETGEEKSYDAQSLGIDSGIDSGMLKIDESERDDFPYLELGISDDLNEGQWVMAVGHPGGIDKARGMVVRIGRIIFKTNRVIRTDCTLVGGDSGGPLIDMNGELIGIHSRIGAKLVDNLHVPADVYAKNWDLLARGIIVDGRPSLGFNVVDNTNEVESVNDKGAAEKAGIKTGDLIIKIESISVEDKEDITNAIAKLNLRPNVLTEIVILRDGEEITIELKVDDRMRSGH
jgi:serine protease Do